jgi:YVTN family beta-propeller protein
VITCDGRTAYVTNEGSNDISVVDIASRRVTATFPVGNAPRKIAVQPVGVDAADPNVHIKNFAFSPATITIAPGQSVTWTNDDSIPHTATADDGKWTSGNLEQGKTYSHKFNAAGNYTYHCGIHPYMKGKVVVKK